MLGVIIWLRSIVKGSSVRFPSFNMRVEKGIGCHSLSERNAYC